MKIYDIDRKNNIKTNKMKNKKLSRQFNTGQKTYKRGKKVIVQKLRKTLNIDLFKPVKYTGSA